MHRSPRVTSYRWSSPHGTKRKIFATVVRSILASTYQPFELLVVDDRSTDETASTVERLAADDPRLRLVRGEALPEGWYGKPWACLQGYRAARGDILLFTDADTRHEPELLSRAVGALRQLNADLVTVSPRQRCETFWERLVMPQIWLLLGLRYHPATVNRARRPRDVIANGQFILTTREAYEAAGTHSAVKHEVAEDLALAQTYLTARRTLYFAFADDLMETRMYRSLRGLIEGWSKNVYLGGRRSFPGEPLLQAMVPVMLAVAIGILAPPTAGRSGSRRTRRSRPRGPHCDDRVCPLLDADRVRNGDSGNLRTRISAGSGNDALHRRSFSLARWTKSHLARSDVPEHLASIFA